MRRRAVRRSAILRVAARGLLPPNHWRRLLAGSLSRRPSSESPPVSRRAAPRTLPPARAVRGAPHASTERGGLGYVPLAPACGQRAPHARVRTHAGRPAVGAAARRMRVAALLPLCWRRAPRLFSSAGSRLCSAGRIGSGPARSAGRAPRLLDGRPPSGWLDRHLDRRAARCSVDALSPAMSRPNSDPAGPHGLRHVRRVEILHGWLFDQTRTFARGEGGGRGTATPRRRCDRRFSPACRRRLLYQCQHRRATRAACARAGTRSTAANAGDAWPSLARIFFRGFAGMRLLLKS